MAEIKFCGMTRAEDARFAAELGAAYVGVIFAGGPRQLTPEKAAMVLAEVTGPRRVGVFGKQMPNELAAIARMARLDVIQLHADPTVDDVKAARTATKLPIWAAIRVRGSELPSHAADLCRIADAVLLDARVDATLGGTGHTLDWSAIRVPRDRNRVILAGGLNPYNVQRALAAFAADVVDVSSGVESSPGIKDHALMRAFADAVRAGIHS